MGDYDYYEFLQKCKDLRDDLIRSDFCEEDKKHLDGYLDNLCGDIEFIINQKQKSIIRSPCLQEREVC